MYNITGKIQKIDLEGGFWAIIDINTQKKYLPDEELPAQFQKDNLNVQVTFEPSAKSTVYQWGRTIHVLDIQKLYDEN